LPRNTDAIADHLTEARQKLDRHENTQSAEDISADDKSKYVYGDPLSTSMSFSIFYEVKTVRTASGGLPKFRPEAPNDRIAPNSVVAGRCGSPRKQTFGDRAGFRLLDG
jgi:hypothetical protein